MKPTKKMCVKKNKQIIKEKIERMETEINIPKNEMSYLGVYQNLYKALDAINHAEQSILIAFDELGQLKVLRTNALEEF